jgi:hypothetical protein
MFVIGIAKVKVNGANLAMVQSRVMLCEVVCFVLASFLRKDVELALAHPISDPIKAHVHSFGALLFNRFVGYAGGRAVVGYNWRWRLWVTHFGKSNTNGAGLFAVVEQASELGFGGASDNFL